jgi:4-amino-4-deoxy-L-arabinose transferase-like glycosyltransferase
MKTVNSRLFDIVFLIVMSLYIVGGTAEVPEHGDESTQIAMGKDSYIQFVERDLSQLYYSPTPLNPADQDVRIYNGTIPKYLFGFVQIARGNTPDTWIPSYDWGAPVDYNQREGRLPTGDLIYPERLTSVLGLLVGLWGLFALGEATGGRGVAYLAAFFYAVHPVILLNGRRAMMEGWLTGFSILVVLYAVYVLQRLRQRHDNKQKFTWSDGLLVLFWGVLCGLCIASKHTGVVTVGATILALGLYGVWRLRQRMVIPLVSVAIAGITSLITFVLLNPVWWGQDPFFLLNRILQSRTELLNGQVAFYGGYPSFIEKVRGFFEFVFVARPQYYEDARFVEPLAQVVARYESNPFRGISFGESGVGGIILAGIVLVGIVACVRGFGNREAKWALLWWGIALVALTLFATPLAWQRYYLPIYPLVGLLAACGIVWIFQLARGRFDHR